MRITLLLLFVSMAVFSCTTSLPKNWPDLRTDINMSQLNTAIKVSVPKSINSYKVDKPIELEIVNLSNQVLKFSIDEMQIFRIENNEWQKVPNKTMAVVINDLNMEPNEVNSDTDLILEPNGVFPGYKRLIGILPDVNPDKAVFLRIFVLAHGQESENMHTNTVGAFVDVPLNP